MAHAVFAPDARRMQKEEARSMKKETKEHIQHLLEKDLEKKQYALNRALIEGRDGVSELNEYRYSLLAKEDFEEERQGNAVPTCRPA